MRTPAITLHLDDDSDEVTLVVARPKRLPRPVVETVGTLVAERVAPVVSLSSYRARRAQGDAS